MLNRDRVIETLAILAMAYPNFELKQETIRIYCDMLQDLDPDLLEQSAKAYLTIGKFFPTIAELRASVADLIERACKTPSAAEAWGEVVEKIRRYGNTLYGGTVPEFSSPIVGKVVSYFGWNDLCLSENSTADRARFIQSFENELKRAHENLQFLPETHEAIARLQAGGSGKVNNLIKQLTESKSNS